MADCTKVILVFDDGHTKTIDATKIDSIFFDDEAAKCFAKNCLDPDPDGKKPLDKLNEATEAAGEKGGGGNPGSNPGAESKDTAYDGGGQTATLTADAQARTLSVVAGPCIHMTDCSWDCGPH